MGWRPPQHTILLAPQNAIANPFYLDLWKPYISIISDPIAIQQHWNQSLINEEHIFITEVQGQYLWLPYAWSAVQKAWSEQQRPPLLKLDEATKEKGWN